VVFVTFVCPKTTGKMKRKETENKNKGSITIFVNNTSYLKTAITYSFPYLMMEHLNEAFHLYFKIEVKETNFVKTLI